MPIPHLRTVYDEDEDGNPLARAVAAPTLNLPVHDLRDATAADRQAREAALFDTLRFPEGNMAEFQAYGHYHETYEKVDGAWKIKSSRLTRLRVDTFMR